jgi:hypothetical protein
MKWQMREKTMEIMAMAMLGAAGQWEHHDYRQGIGHKAKKEKKAKRRMQKQSRRKNR